MQLGGGAAFWSYDSMRINYQKIGIGFILMASVLLVIIFITLIIPKEIHTSTNDNSTSISSVNCNKKNDEGAFFTSEKAQNSRHIIKATFRDNTIDKMNYTYEADFDTEKDAETELSLLHANYNIFMGKVELDIELLTPNFSRFGKTNVINLYIVRSSMRNGIAKLLFLSDDKMGEIPEINIDRFAKIYSDMNFTCNINN